MFLSPAASRRVDYPVRFVGQTDCSPVWGSEIDPDFADDFLENRHEGSSPIEINGVPIDLRRDDLPPKACVVEALTNYMENLGYLQECRVLQEVAAVVVSHLGRNGLMEIPFNNLRDVTDGDGVRHELIDCASWVSICSSKRHKGLYVHKTWIAGGIRETDGANRSTEKRYREGAAVEIECTMYWSVKQTHDVGNTFGGVFWKEAPAEYRLNVQPEALVVKGLSGRYLKSITPEMKGGWQSLRNGLDTIRGDLLKLASGLRSTLISDAYDGREKVERRRHSTIPVVGAQGDDYSDADVDNRQIQLVSQMPESLYSVNFSPYIWTTATQESKARDLRKLDELWQNIDDLKRQAHHVTRQITNAADTIRKNAMVSAGNTKEDLSGDGQEVRDAQLDGQARKATSDLERQHADILVNLECAEKLFSQELDYRRRDNAIVALRTVVDNGFTKFHWDQLLVMLHTPEEQLKTGVPDRPLPMMHFAIHCARHALNELAPDIRADAQNRSKAIAAAARDAVERYRLTEHKHFFDYVAQAYLIGQYADQTMPFETTETHPEIGAIFGQEYANGLQYLRSVLDTLDGSHQTLFETVDNLASAEPSADEWAAIIKHFPGTMPGSGAIPASLLTAFAALRG